MEAAGFKDVPEAYFKVVEFVVELARDLPDSAGLGGDRVVDARPHRFYLFFKACALVVFHFGGEFAVEGEEGVKPIINVEAYRGLVGFVEEGVEAVEVAHRHIEFALDPVVGHGAGGLVWLVFLKFFVSEKFLYSFFLEGV